MAVMERYRMVRKLRRRLLARGYRPAKVSQYAAAAASALLLVGLGSYALLPTKHSTAPPNVAPAQAPSDPGDAPAGTPSGASPLPLAAQLHGEILTALQATSWPEFVPPAEEVMEAPAATPAVLLCGSPTPPTGLNCTWGNPSAPTRAVLIGDSVAMAYLGPLMDIALNSGGKLQIHNEAQFGCNFIDGSIANTDQTLADACPDRKQHAIDYINEAKPDIVFISHTYTDKIVAGTHHVMTPREWALSMNKFVQPFKGSVKKFVFLAPPPADKIIGDCYGKRSSAPADCISRVSTEWRRMRNAEQGFAQILGGTWIDSRPWFCAASLCPSFVGDTLTKRDAVHMSQPYGKKIEPIIAESLKAAGVLVSN